MTRDELARRKQVPENIGAPEFMEDFEKKIIILKSAHEYAFTGLDFISDRGQKIASLPLQMIFVYGNMEI